MSLEDEEDVVPTLPPKGVGTLPVAVIGVLSMFMVGFFLVSCHMFGAYARRSRNEEKRMIATTASHFQKTDAQLLF
jgi:hypothetical protein